MLNEDGYIDSWIETGIRVAEGGSLTMGDLKALYFHLELEKINPTDLPSAHTVAGTASMRKDAIFATARKLWGLEPQYWLDMENHWLMSARSVYGSSEKSGKDKLDDVISAEILVRCIAAINLAIKVNGEGLMYRTEVADEALFALNVTLMEVCAKGRTRMQRIDGTSVYSFLKNGGLMIGAGGGKYLPKPKETLPVLLMMLHRNRLRQEVYLS